MEILRDQNRGLHSEDGFCAIAGIIRAASRVIEDNRFIRDAEAERDIDAWIQARCIPLL